MTRLSVAIGKKFDEFLKEKKIRKGSKPVPIGYLLECFEEYSPDLPLSKCQVGRLLTEREFLKKQYVLDKRGGAEQCYFLNKEELG